MNEKLITKQAFTEIVEAMKKEHEGFKTLGDALEGLFEDSTSIYYSVSHGLTINLLNKVMDQTDCEYGTELEAFTDAYIYSNEHTKIVGQDGKIKKFNSPGEFWDYLNEE